jgi:16S rRNA (adenine1518-N6/adenine1519-N6)-dimethyltransferase
MQRARKRFGQHFLTDPRILDRIVGALQLRGDETVIEVGPGRGALTDRLARQCARLAAIEIDRDLVADLEKRYASLPNVEIITGDVLDMPLGDVAKGPYVLIGNVPYYITTPILFHALERPRALRSVFLVQREVAERMAAPAGSEAYGALSVNVQSLAKVDLVLRVPASAFKPAPKVESAVVRVTPRPDPVVTAEEEKGFSRFVISAFSQRRKQLKSIVRSIAGLGTDAATAVIEKTGIPATARPETLTATEFAVLYRAVRGQD